MKVKELIELLKQHDPESNVMIDFTDHTDWRYTIDLKAEDVSMGEPSIEDIEWEHLFDEAGNYTGKRVLLLQLSL